MVTRSIKKRLLVRKVAQKSLRSVFILTKSDPRYIVTKIEIFYYNCSIDDDKMFEKHRFYRNFYRFHTDVQTKTGSGSNPQDKTDPDSEHVPGQLKYYI